MLHPRLVGAFRTPHRVWCFPRLLPLQPKYLKRWVDLSALWFKHSKSRGNLRASVEAAGLQCECSACSVQFG